MAHESHAPDTTFVIAEPDFVFCREDGEAHLNYLSTVDQVQFEFEKYEEMADFLTDPQAKESFREELQQYLLDVQTDKNAPWPAEPPAMDPNSPDQQRMR